MAMKTRQRTFTVHLETSPVEVEVNGEHLGSLIELLEAEIAKLPSHQRAVAPTVSANTALRTLAATASVDLRRLPENVGERLVNNLAFSALAVPFEKAARRAGLGRIQFAEATVEVDEGRGDRHELLSGAEVARRIGVTRQRIAQLAEKPGRFPHPVAEIGNSRIWRWGDVTDWARASDRETKMPRRRASA